MYLPIWEANFTLGAFNHFDGLQIHVYRNRWVKYPFQKQAIYL